jgi:demethylmenaquinone methyltransferase / 2-methoxy-6-polyprenyl-1,4-benzoquinol methylase
VVGASFGERSAYTYLPESVKRFPQPDGLAAMMSAAGLGRIRYLVLAGGIIAIHSGTRGDAT